MATLLYIHQLFWLVYQIRYWFESAVIHRNTHKFVTHCLLPIKTSTVLYIIQFSITFNMFFYFVMYLRVTESAVIWELPSNEWRYEVGESKHIRQKNFFGKYLKGRMNEEKGAWKQWPLRMPRSHLTTDMLKLCLEEKTHYFP